MKLIISEEEKQYLIRELSNRIKDTILMNARSRTEEAVQIFLNAVGDKDLKPEEKFAIQFEYDFVINDILQIVGRYRRRRNRNKR